jgi:hypothetical protein
MALPRWLRTLLLCLLAVLAVLVGMWIPARILRLHLLEGGWNYLEVTGEWGAKTGFRISFFVHLVSAVPVVVLGWLQFIHKIRRKWPALHRLGGKLYIAFVLLLAAPSGLGLAFGAAGGWPAKIAFFLICPLWWFFTYRAWRLIVQKKVDAHRKMMMRSFAMSFGAVSLRLWMFVAGGLLGWHTALAYAGCVWVAWGVNLMVAEGFIGLGKSRLKGK